MNAATVDPQTVEEQSTRAQLEPRFHLVLMDDDEHSYAYVVDLLGHVLGYGPEKAFALACVVDSTGRAIVETADHECVLSHQRQIHAFGPDPRIPRCHGSTSAIIEAAP
jgi:ATP-dependent Clp protease adaptor protein ClpS